MMNLAVGYTSPSGWVFFYEEGCGKVPLSWKRAHITPVFKGGDKSLVTNYRPVALTSVFCKLLEGFIVKNIQEHINANGLLNPGKHGFVSDDVLIFRNIYSSADEHQLQSDLVALNSWCAINGMTFNTSKTKVMHITRSRHANPPTNY
ncbi:uncharacterized protein LOC121405776 [Lytechinus variegatus]|uniref:uncharacterized protein LOC121405776 n=1 Tax=Lytechinus variegatus TaxID=7654 RepID=UPI001BB2ABC7|nr:uncharacterized protein LOC121405776 [Lytechinus variegatus]